MKLIISESEKKRILGLHSIQKKLVVNEQTESLKKKLQSMIDNQYFTGDNLSVVEMDYTDKDRTHAIERKSKTTNTARYYFITGEVLDKDEQGNYTFNEKKWDVGGYLESNNNKQIESLKNSEWKTESELVNLGIPRYQLNDPELYIKNTDYGVTLYKSKTLEQWHGSYTDEQKGFIEQQRKSGFHPKHEFPIEIHNTLDCKNLQGMQGLFPTNFLFCKDPNNPAGLPKNYSKYNKENKSSQNTTWTGEKSGTSGQPDTLDSSEENENLITNDEAKGVLSKNSDPEFARQVLNQVQEDKNECKTQIQAFYFAWYNKLRITESAFNNTKTIVQACINQHNFNNILGRNSRTDDYIDILTGKGEGGPNTDSKFRLKPATNSVRPNKRILRRLSR